MTPGNLDKKREKDYTERGLVESAILRELVSGEKTLEELKRSLGVYRSNRSAGEIYRSTFWKNFKRIQKQGCGFYNGKRYRVTSRLTSGEARYYAIEEVSKDPTGRLRGFAPSFINKYSTVTIILLVIVLTLILAARFGGNFTGFAVFRPVNSSTSQELNLSFTSPSNVYILLNGVPLSFSLSGVLSGPARVFLLSGNESFLVLNSSLLAPSKPILTDEAVLVLNFVNGSGGSTGMSTFLDYYTSDFGSGFSKPDGVVGLSVSNSTIPENASSLCTLWEVYSLDHASANRFCFGDKECCMFSGFEPSSEDWNDTLYLYVGIHGASPSSIASAEVMSVKSVLRTPGGEFMYGGWRSLPVFFQQPFYNFSGVCVDTCSLKAVGSNISLYVDLEANSYLHIEGVDFGPGYVMDLTNVTVYSIDRNRVFELAGGNIYPKSDGFSVEAWIKTSNVWDSIIVSSNECCDVEKYWGMGLSWAGTSTPLFIKLNDGSGEIYGVGVKNLADDRWHHVVFVRDVSQRVVRGYVDGELDLEFADTTGEILDVSDRLLVGGSSDIYLEDRFNGTVAGLRTYPFALNPDEVKVRYLRNSKVTSDIK